MGGCGRPRWEAKVGGHGRPNLGSLIDSDRSHDKMWEAEAVGGRKWEGQEWEAVGGRGRLWEAVLP